MKTYILEIEMNNDLIRIVNSKGITEREHKTDIKMNRPMPLRTLLRKLKADIIKIDAMGDITDGQIIIRTLH